LYPGNIDGYGQPKNILLFLLEHLPHTVRKHSLE
jgi:hypothetical protein